MNIYEIIAKYGKGKGEASMWKAVRTISDYIEDHEDDLEGAEDLYKKMYEELCGKHFNKDYAIDAIRKMYYVDGTGNVRNAPYWTEERMHEVYISIKNLVPDTYTEHDVWVVMNMIKSDYGMLIESWMPGSEEQRILEMAVCYMNDPDAKNKENKIWEYVMG